MLMVINTITKIEMWMIMRNKVKMIKINAIFTPGLLETSTNL